MNTNMNVWRPHTTGILIGGVVLIILASAIAYMITTFQPKTQIEIGSGVWQAKVVSTEAARQKGLAGVEKMAASDAMIFVFDKDSEWGIWMKDMKIPIDIVWLTKEKKVVYIVKNADPELSTTVTYRPKEPARYVVELPAGAAQQNAIRIGQVAEFNLGGEK